MAYIPTRLPGFTYTGSYETKLDSSWGWYLYLKGDGVLTFTDHDHKIDVCLVGGGGGGEDRSHTANSAGGAGGSGGEVISAEQIAAKRGTAYAIVIGKGGETETGGGTTEAFGMNADGGTAETGGAGASQGSASGSAGGDGVYPFGERSLIRYGADGGGGGGAYAKGASGGEYGGGKGGDGGGPGISGKSGEDGMDGTGAGGGGGGGGETWYTDSGARHENMGGTGGAGGSGVVIIRNNEEDVLPVFFNGTQLQAIWLNGKQAASLIYDGIRLYLKRMKKAIYGEGRRRRRIAVYGKG